jgi:tRNA-splicing ligase RtcB
VFTLAPEVLVVSRYTLPSKPLVERMVWMLSLVSLMPRVAIGEDYIRGMILAGQYAYAGREYVARHVVKNILGGNIIEEIHNHHNFAWHEVHDNGRICIGLSARELPLQFCPIKKGFVGGSMGDNSVILQGVESELSKKALYSTVHGAGRIMSRAAAKGRICQECRG